MPANELRQRRLSGEEHSRDARISKLDNTTRLCDSNCFTLLPGRVRNYGGILGKYSGYERSDTRLVLEPVLVRRTPGILF